MINNIYFKILNLIKEYGLSKTVKKIILWIFLKFDPIHRRRLKISHKLNKLFNSTVKYGPFKGLKFSNKTWWGSSDIGSMLLGIYEKEILNSLMNIPKNYSTFINLGAADGYYCIGALINNLFQHSICYEISKEGRKIIKENAELNNVIKKIDIRGIAKKKFFTELPLKTISDSVLLIDIEGAEFELIDEETFKAFNKSIIFIELHQWLFYDENEKLIKLTKDSILTHNITKLQTGSRDLSIFPELKTFHDNDRWLICSEGRPRLMTWLRFDPK
jgi:hypothetical protein